VNPQASGLKGQGGELTPEQGGLGFGSTVLCYCRVPDNHDQASPGSRLSIQFFWSSPPPLHRTALSPISGNLNAWFVKLQYSYEVTRTKEASAALALGPSSLHPPWPSTSTLTSNIEHRPTWSADLGEKAAQIWCADGAHTDHTYCTYARPIQNTIRAFFLFFLNCNL
jgi:hypothetical protein